jgi:hypothetical protein
MANQGILSLFTVGNDVGMSFFAAAGFESAVDVILFLAYLYGVL